MAALRVHGSTIERASPLQVSLLENAGHLPPMPAEYAVNRALPGFRQPTITEGAEITWLLAGRGEPKKITGILGYRDHYDFHDAADVKEIVYLNGNARACVEMLRYCQAESKIQGRRMIGSIDIHNKPLAKVLMAMGATPCRVDWEDRG